MEYHANSNNPFNQDNTFIQNQSFSHQNQQNVCYNTQANQTIEPTTSTQNDQLTEEQQEQQLLEQLSILDNSLTFTTFIIISILLNQQVIRTQRCQLINQTSNNNCIYRLRLSSSLIIIISLFYFYNLSKDLLATSANNPTSKKSNCINNATSGLVLSASILRLLDLLQNNSGLD